MDAEDRNESAAHKIAGYLPLVAVLLLVGLFVFAAWADGFRMSPCMWCWIGGVLCGIGIQPVVVLFGRWLWAKVARPHRPGDGPIMTTGQGDYARTISDRIVAIAKSIPENVMDELPRDGATNHDHYLYGATSKPHCTDPLCAICRLNRELDVIACRPESEQELVMIHDRNERIVAACRADKDAT